MVSVLSAGCRGMRMTDEEASAKAKEYLSKAVASYGTDSLLIYVDLGRNVMKGHNDKRVELALNSIEPSYWLERDTDKYLASVQPYRDACMKYGETKKYLSTFMSLVTRLIANGNLVDAIKVASHLHDDAIKLGEDIGYEFTYKAYARIYKSRDDIYNARRYYLKALDYTETDQSRGQVFYNIAGLFPEASDSSLYYLSEALKTVTSLNDSLVCYSSMANAYAMRQDRTGFDRMKKNIQDLLPRLDNESLTNEEAYQRMRVHDACFAQDWVRARMFIDSISNPELRLRMMGFEALQRKDSVDAYIALAQYDEYRDSLSQSNAGLDLSKIEAQVMEDEMRLLETSQKSKIRGIMLISTIIILLLLTVFIMLYTRETHRSMKQQELLSESLRQANEAKTHMVQNVSHEIRTPLNAIIGFSQILSMPADFVTDEERSVYGKYIMNNYGMLSMLIDDILSLSDIEHNNYVMVYADTNVNAICENSIQCAMSRCPAGVEMKWESGFSNDFKFESDGKRIQQIIINFLTNSCKHTQSGEIVLSASPVVKDDAQYVRFAVRDTGTGVPPEKALAIFDRFCKLNTFVQGAGLGLSISKLISDKLHADIYLDTSYTGGALFVLEVPVFPVKEEQSGGLYRD